MCQISSPGPFSAINILFDCNTGYGVKDSGSGGDNRNVSPAQRITHNARGGACSAGVVFLLLWKQLTLILSYFLDSPPSPRPGREPHETAGPGLDETLHYLMVTVGAWRIYHLLSHREKHQISGWYKGGGNQFPCYCRHSCWWFHS